MCLTIHPLLLNARHILQLMVAFQDHQEVVLVQPYAAGGDLLKLLRSWGGTLGEREAVRGVVGPLLQALVYLHSHGILHRWGGWRGKRRVFVGFLMIEPDRGESHRGLR
jgi:serine/threonine protein kinase